MSKLIILMYHILYETDEEWNDLNDDEKPYAISVEEFNKQLDVLERKNISILDPIEVFEKKNIDKEYIGVVLTFDDGHNSFYSYAYKILKRRGYRAIFFITTDLIESRNDFCSWSNLAEMVKSGFMIQSHGKTHDFLPDMNKAALNKEFQESKKLLEYNTGQKVYSISFPGGRYSRREIDCGKSNDYRMFFTSRIGIVSDFTLKNKKIFCRVPIRNGIRINTFLKLCEGRKSVFFPRKTMYQLKQFIKLVIGNRVYHVVYKKIFK